MHRTLGPSLALALLVGSAQAHALFPGFQVVQTVGDRALVRLQAANGRSDVSEFIVELFEGDSWMPARLAVASPDRFLVTASDPRSAESSDRTFSVMIDLDGQKQRRLRVCTKTVIRPLPGRRPSTNLNTRVCSTVIVRRFTS